jgi:hypothetical protein
VHIRRYENAYGPRRQQAGHVDPVTIGPRRPGATGHSSSFTPTTNDLQVIQMIFGSARPVLRFPFITFFHVPKTPSREVESTVRQFSSPGRKIARSHRRDPWLPHAPVAPRGSASRCPRLATTGRLWPRRRRSTSPTGTSLGSCRLTGHHPDRRSPVEAPCRRTFQETVLSEENAVSTGGRGG